MSCGSEVSVGKHPKFHRENLQKHVIGPFNYVDVEASVFDCFPGSFL